jgi:hypothetical protein
MNRVFIYRYIAFALGVLSLIVLVVYSWRVLQEICQRPVRCIVCFYRDGGGLWHPFRDHIVSVHLRTLAECSVPSLIIFINPQSILPHLSLSLSDLILIIVRSRVLQSRGYKDGVRGHLSSPLLFLTMSICIPYGLYTYPTTSVPLRPPRDNRRSLSISRYSTIRPTWSQPRLMPRNYHCLHRSNVTWPYGTLRWSLDFHIWKAWY